MAHNTNDIRNIALVGHGFSGKTTLNEAILFTGKAITHLGRVDQGKSVSDYLEQEIEKKMSIRSAVSFTGWNNAVINVIDTPGASDFQGEVIAALRAADTAVFVLSAEEGVEIETIKNWRRCDIPKLVFVNKMGKHNADFAKCLEELKENFKDKNFIPLAVPIGKAADFKGVVDIIDKEARYYEDDGKNIRKEKAPDNIEGLEEYHTKMLEIAVETDEALMTKYFDGKPISREEIVAGLKKAIIAGTIIPVLCGDAYANTGISVLMDSIVSYMPCPKDVKPMPAKDNSGKEVLLSTDSAKPPVLFIFKTSIDQFSGRITYFRVVQGQVKNDIELYNPRKNIKLKCGKLFKAVGKNLKDESLLNAGDIGAFIKLDNVSSNDTLSEPGSDLTVDSMNLPQPVYSQAITTENKKDEEKLIAMLQRASEEDPTFTIKFNPETKQNVVSGMGDMQIRLILDVIKEKNKIEAKLFEQKIAFRETIRGKATAEYTHKKQSGGHGQYGKVVIEIYPLEEGKQYEFTNAIVGGAVSKGYIPGCEKGFHEAMENGVLAGYTVVDVGIRIIDGKEHPVDSSEMSFKIASRGAFREAMRNANPVLLEPVMELSVYADNKYMGDILSDLSSKRGRVQGQESLGGGIEMIKALVPQKELLNYSIGLKSITSGTGGFEMSFSKYQAISGKIADDIIAKAKAEKTGVVEEE